VDPASSADHSYAHNYTLTERAQNFLLADVAGNITPYFELFWDTSPQVLLEKASAEKAQENFMLDTGGSAPSQMFVDAMQGQTSHATIVLSPLLDLANSTHFVDVGGGSGTFCIQAYKTYPHLKGSIYELEGVCPIASKYITKAKLEERVQAVPGNMLDDEFFPAADCYAFGNVLHDWPDDTNMALLKKAYKSLPESTGKVVLLEMLISEDIASTTSAAAGLNFVMVANEDGRQYKSSELEKMLKDAGFVDIEVVKSPLTPYSAIVGNKK
jgi:hypothetical protein